MSVFCLLLNFPDIVSLRVEEKKYEVTKKYLFDDGSPAEGWGFILEPLKCESRHLQRQVGVGHELEGRGAAACSL